MSMRELFDFVTDVHLKEDGVDAFLEQVLRPRPAAGRLARSDRPLGASGAVGHGGRGAPQKQAQLAERAEHPEDDTSQVRAYAGAASAKACQP